MAIDSEFEPQTAGCYGNSAVGDPLPRRHKGDAFFARLYPLDSARLVEPSKCNIVPPRHTTPRLLWFCQSCRGGRVVSHTRGTHPYDFIIAACAIIPPPGRKKLQPAPGVPESIVIQPQPEGRELIILRFTGIIEQMCFEIGHRTFAAPTVIPQPGLPTPQPEPHGLQCRNSRGGETERSVREESVRHCARAAWRYHKAAAQHNGSASRRPERQLTPALSAEKKQII